MLWCISLKEVKHTISFLCVATDIVPNGFAVWSEQSGFIRESDHSICEYNKWNDMETAQEKLIDINGLIPNVL